MLANKLLDIRAGVL